MSPRDSHRRLSRRAFFRSSAVALGGAALAGCSQALGPEDVERLPDQRVKKRVAIIGAGLAGLVAGFELTRAGHDVTILEARSRVGGRAFTLRSPFVDGHFVEAGAARIPPTHDLTLGYAAHFGLSLDPFYPASGSFLEYAAGVRRSVEPREFLAERPAYLKVRGGSERLPLAFADSLGPRIRLSSPVTSVEQGATSVTLRGDGGWSLEGDRVLCTVPLPVLNKIRFLPELSPAKRAAAGGGFAYMPSTRVSVQFSTRFWEREGMNGWGLTDWPEELWHPTWDLPGPRGVLLSYVRGERALAIDALPGPARVPAVLEHWESVFPGATAHAEAWAVHSWQEDPWSGRAWAAPTAAQLATYGARLREPEGRIHFAGEHTSDDRGWMQGALASGLRAAAEIASGEGSSE
jgi:monoamine oxidase